MKGFHRILPLTEELDRALDRFLLGLLVVVIATLYVVSASIGYEWGHNNGAASCQQVTK